MLGHAGDDFGLASTINRFLLGDMTEALSNLDISFAQAVVILNLAPA
jgi:hypothetical protein